MSKPDDEKVWSSPNDLAEVGGWLHHNNILFYFAKSPFFDRTSNNAVIHSQAMTNPQMFQYVTTRELFESRLKSMSGLEYIVVDSPATMGEEGNGVWVIRKQNRRKRTGEEDEVTIQQSYFIVGINIYQAPNMADVLTAKIMAVSNSISKGLPKVDSVRQWQPSSGHTYRHSSNQPKQAKPQESKEATPMPGATDKSMTQTASKNDDISLERSTAEAFMIHARFGGEYIDENPITGRPGEFHLSSTGRKPAPPRIQTIQQGGIGNMGGTATEPKSADKKEGKPKTPKSASTPRIKRRKSHKNKGSAATTPAA